MNGQYWLHAKKKKKKKGKKEKRKESFIVCVWGESGSRCPWLGEAAGTMPSKFRGKLFSSLEVYYSQTIDQVKG